MCVALFSFYLDGITCTLDMGDMTMMIHELHVIIFEKNHCCYFIDRFTYMYHKSIRH